MKDVYRQIWDLAKPYYQKGRSYDIPHIEWMMGEVNKIAETEELDIELLMPIAILHDVGYAMTSSDNPNIKDEGIKIAHMREGAKIAKKILDEVGYDKSLTEKIVHYISVHDNWLLGDDSPYKECKEMAVFNDFDFLWVTTDIQIFKTVAKAMKMTPEEFYEFWSKDEKLTRRPFCCDYTRDMWKNSMQDIKNAIM